MWQLAIIALMLYVVFTSQEKPKATHDTQSTDYASEIRSIRDKEKQKQIALAKQKAWKEKGGKV